MKVDSTDNIPQIDLKIFAYRLAKDLTQNSGGIAPCEMCVNSCNVQINRSVCVHGVKQWLINKAKEYSKME